MRVNSIQLRFPKLASATVGLKYLSEVTIDWLEKWWEQFQLLSHDPVWYLFLPLVLLDWLKTGVAGLCGAGCARPHVGAMDALAQGAPRHFAQWLWVEYPTVKLGGDHSATELSPPPIPLLIKMLSYRSFRRLEACDSWFCIFPPSFSAPVILTFLSLLEHTNNFSASQTRSWRHRHVCHELHCYVVSSRCRAAGSCQWPFPGPEAQHGPDATDGQWWPAEPQGWFVGPDADWPAIRLRPPHGVSYHSEPPVG